MAGRKRESVDGSSRIGPEEPGGRGFVSKRQDGCTLSDTVTHLGYYADECRSALNKEIRRGNERAACWWGYQFIRHGWTRYLWSTLRIIASEDVGVADPTAA